LYDLRKLKNYKPISTISTSNPLNTLPQWNQKWKRFNPGIKPHKNSPRTLIPIKTNSNVEFITCSFLDYEYKLWNLKSLELLGTFKFNNLCPVLLPLIDPLGESFYGSTPNGLGLWNLNDENEPKIILHKKLFPYETCIAISNYNEMIVAGHILSGLTVW